MNKNNKIFRFESMLSFKMVKINKIVLNKVTDNRNLKNYLGL